jgi:DNA-binding transcriptional LysR family regulator
MDLADIAVFVEAVRTGSLAGAARRMAVAPMVASRRLAGLETELGVRLVHRTTRALSLTAEGEAFLPHAQAMLDEEAVARAAIRPAETGASGLLRITASAPFGRKVVAPLIPAFMRDNPEVRVDLLLTDTIVDIVAQGIDLAIRIAALRDNTLVARRLADNPRRLYAAPDYIARHGAPRVLADLADHECLTQAGVAHWTFDVGGRATPQKVAGRFTASAMEALHQACLGGLGLARLSVWDAREEVEDGRLVEVPLADAQLQARSIWAVYPTARLAPPKVRLFVAALGERLRGF